MLANAEQLLTAQSMSKQELAGSTVTAALLATTTGGVELAADVFTKGCGDAAEPGAEAEEEEKEGAG